MDRFNTMLSFVGLATFSVLSTHAATIHGPTQQLQEQLALRFLSDKTLTFTENQGQWDEKIQFRANAGGATMWFASDGAYYQFTRTFATEDKSSISAVDERYSSGRHAPSSSPDDILERHHQREAFETMMIKAHFVGSNSDPVLVGLEALEYKCNYFIGNDQSKWATDVPNYSAIMYEEIYDGIDLQYYGNGKKMEYDFIVSPGADYSQIKIKYEGAESISVNANGELVVITMWVEIVEKRPFIYQIKNDNRISVEGKYLIQSENSFSFEINGYDTSLALVIDPVLTYSTYLGGGSRDQGNHIEVDASGAAHIMGYTTSSDFPTLNPYQGIYQGSTDIFVTKLNSSGNSLVYSTYLGGTASDNGFGMAIDASGAVYLTGRTSSNDFPTLNPYQGTIQGSDDAFLTKFNSSGNSLVYSTYLGGTANDIGNRIAVDASGAVYMTGNSTSSNFPTRNPYQGTNQGANDAFVTKFNSFGDSLVYSTYLGGNMDDFGYGIAVDASGAAYIVGASGSTDFPILNPYQGTYQGSDDIFVTKLCSSGMSLDYSTFLGGSEVDIGFSIAVDTSGAAYITGYTFSTDFPTLNPYQGTNLGSCEMLITKLGRFGNSLIYSTYFGGSGCDIGFSIAIDSFGAAHMTGFTTSTDFPTRDPYQETYQGGISDAFVTKLSKSGNSPIYSTYLDGSGEDLGFSIALDASGAAYITGTSESTDFKTLNPYQGTNQGSFDAFVIKFSDSPANCCIGSTGNIDCDRGPVVDITDLTVLIDHLFINLGPLCCKEAANVDGDLAAIIDITDLTFLIDHLFISLVPTSACQ